MSTRYGTLKNEDVVGGYPWSRKIRITLPDGTNDLVAAGWANWSLKWRPSGGSAQAVTLAVDASLASTGYLTLSATAADTAGMGEDGYAELRGELAGVPVPFARVPFIWEQGINR